MRHIVTPEMTKVPMRKNKNYTVRNISNSRVWVDDAVDGEASILNAIPYDPGAFFQIRAHGSVYVWVRVESGHDNGEIRYNEAP